MAVPMPPLNLTGGASGPAFSDTGDVSVIQGGMNIPAYPFINTRTVTPVDADYGASFGSFDVGVGGDDLFYYVAAALVLLIIVKRKK